LHLIAFFLGPASSAPAQINLSWTGGGADTSWTTIANWSGVSYPNNGQPNPGDTYNATVNTGTPTLNADITINNYTQGGGTVGGASKLTVNGLYTWSGGTMQGTGTTTLNGSAMLSGTLTLDRPVSNAPGSTVTLNSGGNLLANANAAWTNQAGATFNLVDANLGRTAGSSTPNPFTNAGTFLSSGGFIDWDFLNTGTVVVSSGQLTFNLNVGRYADTGSYSIGSGAQLKFNSQARSILTAVSGLGTLNDAGALLSLGGANLALQRS
jgi:hypothetical protein